MDSIPLPGGCPWCLNTVGAEDNICGYSWRNHICHLFEEEVHHWQPPPVAKRVTRQFIDRLISLGRWRGDECESLVMSNLGRECLFYFFNFYFLLSRLGSRSLVDSLLL
jgi:hypothetical protein